MSIETVAKLAAITDAAKFERIATAVLRAAKPSLYENLSHQGVNTDGKTVKAPLDNIGWVQTGAEVMLVAGAHTTASRDGLEGKWLHDPTTVTPRKKGGKPTQPSGDLIKAIEEIKNIREQHPDLKATLALTCNREEPTDLRIKAEALAKKHNIVLDVWSASRLAQFLDTDPEGQAIRYHYFGDEPTRLSMQELLRIGRKSLEDRKPAIDENTLVERKLHNFSGHTLLSGASGMGKTTICLASLREVLQQNSPGIIVDEQTIQRAVSIEEALDIELRRYSPKLEPHSGARALELCSEIQPLMVVVEDINRSDDTVRLLNKLVNWTLRKSAGSSASYWRLMCPVWPRFLLTLDNKKEIDSAGLIHGVGLYSEEEACKAVKSRGESMGRIMDDLSASAIARELGNDPLLIGLHDLSANTSPQKVIAQYVATELERAVQQTTFTITDLEDTVYQLGLQILKQRNLHPSWRDIQTWLTLNQHLDAIRAIVNSGQMLRLGKNSLGQVLEFRHDRVFYQLLASVAERQFTSDIHATFLSDPYFAEIVGMAASTAKLPLAQLNLILASSPLVAFYALKFAVQNDNGYLNIATNAIVQWVTEEEHRCNAYWYRRYRGLSILAEVDSPIVLKITSSFPVRDMTEPPYLEARFRNGDIGAGFQWLSLYRIEVTVAGVQELVDHVCHKYGIGIVRGISATLENPNLSGLKRGVLLLAGHIADASLAPSVRKAWQFETEPKDLKAFLWAAARVCGDEAEATLGPICDAWEFLSDTEDEYGYSERNNLAVNGIDWRFRDHVPKAALPYFVKRAKQSESLNWPITYMLRGVDDPVAVEHEVEFLAQQRRNAKSGEFFLPFLHDEWRRLIEEPDKPMSHASKQRLLEISSDQDNDEYLRKEAFSLWEVSFGLSDIDIARAIKKGDPRYNTALWARARRKDLTVVPAIIEKIPENPRYWWQTGRYLWRDELTEALRNTIREIGTLQPEEHERKGTWIVPELILKLSPEIGESLLLPVWNEIRYIPEFLQCALCIATPKLIEHVRTAVLEAPDPQELFKYFSMTVGIRVKGRQGAVKLKQLNALKPYLKFLSDMDLYELWDICHKEGWFDFAEEHLEPILLSKSSDYIKRVFGGKKIDLTDLDMNLADQKPYWAYSWIESNTRRGARRDDVVAELFDWLREKKSLPALEVVEHAFVKTGSRLEFEQLRGAAEEIQDVENILNSIQFAIFSRTLN